MARRFHRIMKGPLILLTCGLLLIAQTTPNPPLQSTPPSGRDSLPLSMCIVIDDSGSMRAKQNDVKAAVRGLVSASKPGDEVCLVTFKDEAYLAVDLTTDFDRAVYALREIDSRGGSALRDAIQMAADVVEQKAHNRKVLTLITDGDDTSSAFTEKQVQDKIRSSGVQVYSIALLNGQDSGKTSQVRRTLTQLAALSGGRFYQPRSAAEVESMAPEIEREARK